MALPSTVFRLELSLQDVERGVYEDLSLRVARHPSETERFFVARVLAYALSYEPELAFSRGLSTTDEPALWAKDETGRILLWIDIGHPSADRLHRASKLADRVEVYTHRDSTTLEREWSKRTIHRADTIQVTWLDPAFLDRVAAATERSSRWELVRTEGHVYLTIGATTFECDVDRRPLAP